MNAVIGNAAVATRSRMELMHGDAAFITKGRGSRLCVERGTVWVTQHGCVEDICLEAGQCYSIVSDCLIVATMLGRDTCAVMTISAPERCATRSAWRGWFPRFAVAVRTSPVTSTRTA